MSAATQNEMERLERVNREHQQLLDQVWKYVDQQGLAQLGQSRVMALIEAHRQVAAESDALAAHVVRLMGALELARDRIALLAEIATDLGATVYAALDMWPEEMEQTLSETPNTSLARLKDERAQAVQQAVKRARMEWAKEDKAALARLKAGWQASALEVAVITAQMKGQTEVASWLQDLADTCRRQAEGESHD